jgi:hypothetical protein
MGRVGKMPELANLAIFLLAPGSEYDQAGGGGFSALRNWTDEQWEAARASIRGANEQDRAKRTV